jgi:hypothetical protein
LQQQIVAQVEIPAGGLCLPEVSHGRIIGLPIGAACCRESLCLGRSDDQGDCRREIALVERYRNPEAVRCRCRCGFGISYRTFGEVHYEKPNHKTQQNQNQKEKQNHPRQYLKKITHAQIPQVYDDNLDKTTNNHVSHNQNQ